MSDSVAPKAYYSIGEVCDITGLRPHVLRYWETQFEELRPSKNRAGNRVYRPRDVELILLVKSLLYTERFTIAGARRKMAEMREDGSLEGEGRRVLEPEIVRGMRWELDRLHTLLTVPERPGGSEEGGAPPQSRDPRTSHQDEDEGGSRGR